MELESASVTEDDAPVSANSVLDQDLFTELGEFELSLIMRNSCLSKKDLLTLRFVNKTWRDASTVELLRRNVCEIFFHMVDVDIAVEVDPSATPTEENEAEPEPEPTRLLVFCKYSDMNLTLENLTQLISSSPKFPSTKLSYTSDNCLPGDLYNFAPSVEEFLYYHGPSFKTLCPTGSVLASDLKYLLTETPNLEILDLTNMDFLQQEDYVLRLTDEDISVPIKTLRIGETAPRGIVKEILRSAKELESIENVYFSYLKTLMEEEKILLIKDLDFHPYEECAGVAGQLKAKSPKLKGLIVSFEDVIDNDKEILNFPRYVEALNTVIEESKETLEYLELSVNQSYPRNIKIPVCKRLKFLSVDVWGASPNHNFPGRQRHDSLNQNQIHGSPSPATAIGEFMKELENPMFIFEAGVETPNIFPSLKDVRIKAEYFKSDNKLLGLFSYKECTIPTVSSVNISGCGKWPTIPEAMDLSKLLPNIKTLKIRWKEIQRTDLDIMNPIWLLCNLVEFVEIYGVYNIEPNQNQLYFVEHVDSFFTGLGVQLCAELGSKGEEFPEEGKDLEEYRALKTLPSICDLKNLRELKVRFEKLTRPFASKVSGELAFNPVKSLTKARIVFCYDSDSVRDENKTNMDKFLAPLAPYVELTQEEYIEDTGPISQPNANSKY